MNLRSLGYDPKYWKDADKFYPERFLNEKGEFSRPSFLATFGLGNTFLLLILYNLIFLL